MGKERASERFFLLSGSYKVLEQIYQNFFANDAKNQGALFQLR
jgi:hypothetical protein